MDYSTNLLRRNFWTFPLWSPTPSALYIIYKQERRRHLSLFIWMFVVLVETDNKLYNKNCVFFPNFTERMDKVFNNQRWNKIIQFLQKYEENVQKFVFISCKKDGGMVKAVNGNSHSFDLFLDWWPPLQPHFVKHSIACWRCSGLYRSGQVPTWNIHDYQLSLVFHVSNIKCNSNDFRRY